MWTPKVEFNRESMTFLSSIPSRKATKLIITPFFLRISTLPPAVPPQVLLHQQVFLNLERVDHDQNHHLREIP